MDCILYLLKIGVASNVLNNRQHTPQFEIPVSHQNRPEILKFFSDPLTVMSCPFAVSVSDDSEMSDSDSELAEEMLISNACLSNNNSITCTCNCTFR